MKPAYHISLTATEKRLIAELAAIQSQIEWLMMLTLKSLLVVKFETARLMLGSTNFGANAQIWRAVVLEDHPYPEETHPWAEWAFKEMAVLSKGRNDFLHTLYGFLDDGDDKQGELYFDWGHSRASNSGRARVAVRVKNAAVAPLSDLRAIRDRAAYLSIAVAHIEWTSDRERDWTPWFRRLGGRYPPLIGETGPHKARAQPPPPQSSPK